MFEAPVTTPASLLSTIADLPIDNGSRSSEQDEAMLRERLEMYREIIAGNLVEGFTQMPDQVREDPNLSRAAKLVYEQLLRYARQKDRCWPSQERIAKDLVTISRRTVIRAIKELYERGYIEVWRRGLNRTNMYYINPLSFVQSFKRPRRGRGVLIGVNSPEMFACILDVPQPDTLTGLRICVDPASQKCQNDTSRSAKMTHPEVPFWHTKHIELKHIESETKTKGESKTRRGQAAKLRKGTDWLASIPTCSHSERETIRNNKINETEDIEFIEPSNSSNHGEISGPDRTKKVEDNNICKKTHTFEDMAVLVGISSAALDDMLTWLREHKRPETIPLKLQGVIPMWSRDLGNTEPQAIVANVTQASKLYQYARLRGLSQQTTERCFENAREAVRNHPEVKKKMAFFFTSLKLDILVALKQDRDLPAIRSTIPDGYDDQTGEAEPFSADPPSSLEVLEVTLSETSVPESEPDMQGSLPEVPLLQTEQSEDGWSSWEGANNRAEHLRDAVDQYNLTYTWEVLPTPYGRWGFVFRKRQGRVVEQICLTNADILACKARLREQR